MAMALAGAERIFNLIDEEPEKDNGYVTLTHVKFDNSNKALETTDGSGTWAWKHPHHDGSITFTPLKGDVQFLDVDFGYSSEKLVLHHITLEAIAGKKIAFVGATGFRVIIVTVANSLGNIRVFELLPKLKTKKYGWCIA